VTVVTFYFIAYSVPVCVCVCIWAIILIQLLLPKHNKCYVMLRCYKRSGEAKTDSDVEDRRIAKHRVWTFCHSATMSFILALHRRSAACPSRPIGYLSLDVYLGASPSSTSAVVDKTKPTGEIYWLPYLGTGSDDSIMQLIKNAEAQTPPTIEQRGLACYQPAIET